MTQEQRSAIVLACSELINRFAVHNDMGQHRELANLFIEQGRYARPAAPDSFTEGREAIYRNFADRPRDKITRHLITNIIIEVIDSSSARGLCYVTQFSGNLDNPAEAHGLYANPVQLIGEYHDDFVLTPDGWRFRQRSGCLSLTVRQMHAGLSSSN